MTLLTLGLYLPLWFCYGLAQSSFLDSFVAFPAGKNECVCQCVGVCTVLTVLHCTYSAMHAQVLRELCCNSTDTACLVLGFVWSLLSLRNTLVLIFLSPMR